MLALIFDLTGAYFGAKHINKIWLQIIVAVFIGVASSVAGNMIMFLFLQDSMGLGEALQSMVVGIFWHPLFTIVVLLIFRRRINRQGQLV